MIATLRSLLRRLRPGLTAEERAAVVRPEPRRGDYPGDPICGNCPKPLDCLGHGESGICLRTGESFKAREAQPGKIKIDSDWLTRIAMGPDGVDEPAFASRPTGEPLITLSRAELVELVALAMQCGRARWDGEDDGTIAYLSNKGPALGSLSAAEKLLEASLARRSG